MIHQCEKRGAYVDEIELKFQAHEDATDEVTVVQIDCEIRLNSNTM